MSCFELPARLAVVLTGLALCSCAHEPPAPPPVVAPPSARLTVAKARVAYESGRLFEARQLLRNVVSDPASASEVAQLSAQVAFDTQAAIGAHLEWAQRFDPALKPVRADAASAFIYYQAAARLMDASQPQRQDADARVKALGDELVQAAHELQADLDEIANGKVVDEARVRRLRSARRILGVDDQVARLLSDAARLRYASGGYVEARRLVLLSWRFRSRQDEPAADDLDLLALARLRTPAQPAAAASAVSLAAKAALSPPAKRAAPASLLEARRLFEVGDSFSAFVLLDEALRGEPDHAAAQLLRGEVERSASVRAELIAEELDNAEASLRAEQSGEAMDGYRRVLTLDPTNKIALDRVQKIEALWRLQGRKP